MKKQEIVAARKAALEVLKHQSDKVNQAVVMEAGIDSTDPHLVWHAESQMLREITDLVKYIEGKTTFEKVLKLKAVALATNNFLSNKGLDDSDVLIALEDAFNALSKRDQD